MYIEQYGDGRFQFENGGWPDWLLSLKEDQLNAAMARIIEVAHRIVSKYFWSEPPKEYSDLFDILHEYGKLSIFTLNYDVLAERTLKDYNDGFVPSEPVTDYEVFDPIHALDYPGQDIVNHLHGCVCYNYLPSELAPSKRRLFKYDKPVGNYSGGFTISSDKRVLFSPIITGIRKQETLMLEPFSCYLSNFIREMNSNDILVVIGYGFGDYHVNALIDLYMNSPGKVMVVIGPSPADYMQDYLTRGSEECGNCYYRDGISLWFDGGFKDAMADSSFLSLLKKLIGNPE